MIQNINISDTQYVTIDSFLVSDEVLLIFTWVVYGVLCQVINGFGIVTNCVNIICFINQGFDESVNISFLGLAVSDLCSLVTMMFTCVCLTPAVIAADLSFDPVEVSYLVSAMPHFTFIQISSCITASITLERCLCITAPLKIKSLITPKRTTVIIICIFTILFSANSPLYVVNKLGFSLSPTRNKTLLGLISRADREVVEKITFTINNFCIPFGAFVIIVVCTIILSVQLRSQSQWRTSTVTSTQVEKVSSRNLTAAKMVTMISVLFIVCFIPLSIAVMIVGMLPDMSVHGKYVNITLLIAGCGYILEGINSSMNIFIYYRMSSKYRQSFSHTIIICTQQVHHSTNVLSSMD